MGQTFFISVLIVILGYLMGSIPSAYIFGRLLRGRDLRRYGSGTVSGSMVYEHVARWAVVPVALLDVAKAAVPAWLVLRLGFDTWVIVATGIAAAIGHNWPIFLNFTGGRGISTFIGLLLIIFPCGIPWLLVFLLVGYFLKDSPPFAMVSLVTLPILAFWLDGSAAVIWATIIMLIITILKRLEANRRVLPDNKKDCLSVLLRRLIYDRDIASHAEWINRRPNTD